MKKILITGGSGYIGQNLFWKAWSKNKINFDYTLCDKDTILPNAQYLKKNHLKDFYGVIHLAALSGIAACEENLSDACVDNIMTARNVFKLATELNIPVVFTSSQAAKNPDSSVYATMKWTCENLADYYNNIGGKIYVVRLANVYGGGNYFEKKNTCVKQFVIKYLNGESFKIHGDGSQKRDFVHVWDICEAINRILTIKPDYFKPIDIGTGKATSILELAGMFPKRELDNHLIESRNAGEKSSIANILVLKELVDFIPSRDLRDYIKEITNG